MSNFPVIGDGPFGGDVLSVDGRTGVVILADLYASLGHTHSSGDIISFLGYVPEDAADKAVANGYASLDAGGKLPTSQLPPLSITSVFVVSSEVEQLALTVEEGDVAIRTDESKSYIALNDVNASMSDWQELLNPGGGVTSVDGRIGVVTLDDLYANTSGSSIIDQVAVASDADGNIKFASVTMNAGRIENITITEQTGARYLKTDSEDVYTSTGRSGGDPKGRMGITSASLFRLRLRTGGPVGGISVLEAALSRIDALTDVYVTGDFNVSGVITGNTGFVVKPSGSSSILLTDANKWIEVQNGASTATMTIEPDTTANLPIGSSIFSSKIGDGEVTYAKGSGVTFGSALGNVNFKIDGRGDKGAWIQFIKRAANTWYVSGPIKSV